jgi:hypothetical protein
MEPTPFLDTPNKETEGVDKGRGRISARISRRKRGKVGKGDQMSGTEMRSARARVYIQSHRWCRGLNLHIGTGVTPRNMVTFLSDQNLAGQINGRRRT